MIASIVITSFNYGDYIERCIRSCLNQRWVQGHEVIVVDDCSTDNTHQVLEKYESHPGVRVFRTKKNAGVATASNIGFKEAFGQFVVRVDADDYISRDFLFYLVTLSEANHDAFGVSCDYQLVDNYENKIERKYATRDPIACGILYRKDVLARVGYYNSEYRHCEEEELRKRIGDDYKLYNINIPLYRYRMHSSNKTKQSDYLDVRKELHDDD